MVASNSNYSAQQLRIIPAAASRPGVRHPDCSGTTVVQLTPGITSRSPPALTVICGSYVNGQEEGTAQAVSYSWIGENYYHLGGNAAFTGNYSGVIDDVRVYRKQLSGAEVQALYSQGNALVHVQAPMRWPANRAPPRARS